MRGFTIRDAEARDARGIARVHVRCWQTAYAGLVPGEFVAAMSVESSTMRWLRSLADPTQAGALVAEDDAGSLMGWCAFGLNRNGLGLGVGEVYGVYVEPDCWRRGAGGALLRAAEEGLTRAGYLSAILWTLENDARSRGFFEACGWSFDGVTDLHEAGVTVVRYSHEQADLPLR